MRHALTAVLTSALLGLLAVPAAAGSADPATDHALRLEGPATTSPLGVVFHPIINARLRGTAALLSDDAMLLDLTGEGLVLVVKGRAEGLTGVYVGKVGTVVHRLDAVGRATFTIDWR